MNIDKCILLLSVDIDHHCHMDSEYKSFSFHIVVRNNPLDIRKEKLKTNSIKYFSPTFRPIYLILLEHIVRYFDRVMQHKDWMALLLSNVFHNNDR